MGYIGTEPGKAETPEYSEFRRIGGATKQTFKRRRIRHVSFRHTINKIDSCGIGKRPKSDGDFGLMEECETGIRNMAMTAFRIPIVFRCMWWRCEVGDALGGEKAFESEILASIVCEQSFYFCGKIIFNKVLECKKGGTNVRFTT